MKNKDIYGVAYDFGDEVIKCGNDKFLEDILRKLTLSEKMTIRDRLADAFVAGSFLEERPINLAEDPSHKKVEIINSHKGVETFVEEIEFETREEADKYVNEWNEALFYAETPSGGQFARIKK